MEDGLPAPARCSSEDLVTQTIAFCGLLLRTATEADDKKRSSALLNPQRIARSFQAQLRRAIQARQRRQFPLILAAPHHAQRSRQKLAAAIRIRGPVRGLARWIEMFGGRSLSG